MDPIGALALGLAVVLLASKIAGHVALRLGAPSVLGELFVGMALAAVPVPFLRDLAQVPAVDTLSRLGALILVFEVGLVLTVREVLAVGAASIAVAVVGSGLTFCFGWTASALLLHGAPGQAGVVHVFVGAAITATSIGITARVLKELGQTRTREGRIIVGAAVLDDVIGLVVLTVVTGWIASKTATSAAHAPSLLVVVGKSVGFLVVAVGVGVKLAPRLLGLSKRLESDGALVAMGLSICFGLSYLASLAGLAAIIGAFAAGLIVEETHPEATDEGGQGLSSLIAPISSFLVPIFFVVMGMRAHLEVFRDGRVAAFALGLTVAAVVGKLGAGLMLGPRNGGLAIGIGMIPRGEVTLVFAGLGLSVSAIDARIYSSLVVVVVLTTLITPGLLKWSLRRAARS